MAFCTDCGTISPDGSLFCPKCGKKFGAADPGRPLTTLDLATQRPAGKERLGYTSSLSSRFYVMYAVAAFVVLSPLAYFAWMMRDSGIPVISPPPPSAENVRGAVADSSSDASKGGRSTSSASGTDSRAVELLAKDESPSDYATLKGEKDPAEMARSLGVSVQDLSTMQPRTLAERAQDFMLRSDTDLARRLTTELLTRMLAVAYEQDGRYPAQLDSTYEEGLGRRIDTSIYDYQAPPEGASYVLSVWLRGSYSEDDNVVVQDGRSRLVVVMQGETPVSPDEASAGEADGGGADSSKADGGGASFVEAPSETGSTP